MEIRAMDLIDKEDQNKRIKIVTRFLIKPNEPERTYIYGPGNAFEIEEDHVSGVMVYAADDALAPDIEKGMRLLVNTAIKTYDGDDYYVFERGSEKLKDIAKLVRNDDGSFTYTSDVSSPQRLPDLENLIFLGKVHEVQVHIPFMGYANEHEFPTANFKEYAND